jgi:hypothetical protein
MEVSLKSPIVLLSRLLTDVSRLLPDVKGLDRDIITIKARFEHEGISFLAVTLSSLRDALDRGLASGRFSCPSSFSKVRRGALPRLFSGLLSKVFNPTTGTLEASPDVGAIKCLREVLSLFKKVRTNSSREVLLHKKACTTFWDAEDYLQGFAFSEDRLRYLNDCARFTLVRLHSWNSTMGSYRNGPGAVFERVRPNQKWSSLHSALEGEQCDLYKYGLGDYLASSKTQETLTEFVENEPDTSSRGLARLITVPKSSTSRRTITVEPALNMFLQQGLNTGLRSEIERCSVLKNCLALTDQSENQKLALKGSLTGEYATLDLKSASDLLSLRVVETVFGRFKSFFALMVDSRTPEVLDDTKYQRKLLKFAGMGNALTFPTQSVCFALFAISAILFAKGKKPSYWNVKATSRHIRVFGDDIIVPTEYAHQVVDWIESFGLKVNRGKSFMEGNFRESCGLDAFRGYDVTPIYIKDDPAEPQMDASACAGFVAASNSAWNRCLYNLADALQDHVEGNLRRYLPYVSAKSGALGWTSRLDRCEYQKWDPHLQRFTFRAPIVVADKAKDNLDGYPALLKFFSTSLLERPVGHLKRTIKRFCTRIVWRWMPAEAG